MIRDIVHSIGQYISRTDRPIYALSDDKYLPSGWINERVNTCDWEPNFTKVGGVFCGSCWPVVFLMLSISEIPGVYIDVENQKVCVFDHIHLIDSKYFEDKIVLMFKNTTIFDAEVSIFTDRNKNHPFNRK